MRYYILDVFTHTRLKGNPLAIVLDADELSPQTMQAIAREFNLSETTFVLKPTAPNAVRRIRIFTPILELPLAGHPVIGTWFLLASKNLVTTANGWNTFHQELLAGVLPVEILKEDNRVSEVWMTQATPQYAASGGLEGHPVDSFSLDMKDGYLRAAVNTMQIHSDAKGAFQVDRSSFARVLDPSLREVGSVELAPGEWVTASRFLGDSGFVVTFRSIDPLFALDLRDPAHPQKAGVLEMQGFSTYLQPIDATHLVGIGVDVPPPPATWHDRSLQLSVFDVSDLSHPQRTVQLRVGSAFAYSEALWEHHAFNWFPEKQLLAVPFFDWSPEATGSAYWGSFASDLRVFEIHPDSAALLGALSMKDVYVVDGDGQWTWSWSPAIRRSVMAADAAGNTFVYAISDAGVRVAALEALDVPLATAVFPHH